ncbi:MAG: hypothetical protein VB025_09280 [Sphaerochaeta sp.]|nr:hypothetical protein [Sphaerochaeta sp.]
MKFLVGLFLLVWGLALIQIVRVGSMSDADREECGHGPKGQGR